VPYLSASAIVIHYEEALYQVYLYLRLDDDDMTKVKMIPTGSSVV